MKRLLILAVTAILATNMVHGQYSLQSWGGGQPQFNTYNEMMGGKTEVNQVNVNIQRYNGQNNLTEWRLTARLVQDYVNASNSAYSIGAQYSYLQFNGQENSSSNGTLVNAPTQPIQLNKFTEVTLIESTVPLTGSVYRLFKYNLIIQGGNHMLAGPNGTYHSAYEFKLYRLTGGGNAQLVATKTESVGASARFQINYSGNYGGQSLTIQNGAQQFNMQFSTAADYTTGKSVLVNNAINITSYSNYQLAIKASGNFTSSTSSEVIPISVLKAELTTSQVFSGLQLISPITLSTSDQIIAVRSQNNPNAVNYNLRFYIPPNTPGLTVVPGTYTTYVYFVIIPN